MKTKRSKLLQELIQIYSEKGYEGKYLMVAVFKAALIISVFVGDVKAAEFFNLRIKQTEREISITK